MGKNNKAFPVEIPRQSGIKVNAKADKLAKEGRAGTILRLREAHLDQNLG